MRHVLSHPTQTIRIQTSHACATIAHCQHAGANDDAAVSDARVPHTFRVAPFGDEGVSTGSYQHTVALRRGVACTFYMHASDASAHPPVLTLDADGLRSLTEAHAEVSLAPDVSRRLVALTVTPGPQCPECLFLQRSSKGSTFDVSGLHAALSSSPRRDGGRGGGVDVDVPFEPLELTVTSDHVCRVHGACTEDRCTLVVASDMDCAGIRTRDEVESGESGERGVFCSGESATDNVDDANAPHDDIGNGPEHRCVSLAPTTTPSAPLLRGLGRALGIALVIGCPVGVQLSPPMCKVKSPKRKSVSTLMRFCCYFSPCFLFPYSPDSRELGLIVLSTVVSPGDVAHASTLAQSCSCSRIYTLAVVHHYFGTRCD
jgi:hypothetical protein